MLQLNRAGDWSSVGRLFSACSRVTLSASLVAAAALFSGPAAIAGDNPDELRAFAGVNPFDRVKGRSLFEMPEVRSRIQALLGKKGLDHINGFAVSPPAEEHSGWLVAHGCKRHDCYEADWAVAINLANYNVFVCLGDKGKPVKYAATGQKLIELPPKKEFPCPEIADAVPAFERVFARP